MSTLRNLYKARFSRVFKRCLPFVAVVSLVSCAGEDDRILHMSQYDASKGEKPEFMLSGYEDYKIKISRSDFRVENKVTFDELASMFSFDSEEN